MNNQTGTAMDESRKQFEERRQALLDKAAEIAMASWSGTDEVRRFACKVSDYLMDVTQTEIAGSGCRVNTFSSRVCERGTKSCVVAHEEPQQAARSLTERSRADVLEEAAKVCERLTSEYRDAYKGRIEPIDRSRLYNPHTEGLSDGAWECAEAIRALASYPSGKPGGEG